ncbi:hypothetical protein [Metallosphaera javensis (ex Sakai et al. 2022)]|uniref:hypothetical protein n=1 Tax=Metallosphaera javensis (ex Sakai et al. 2022) TaxID=2775498 RepID=UPI002588FF60|nr:MAG: hypothetical protein MjAS7_2024 [Metallosphaera javensis (ex Sakai et al. 2022)]
MRSLKIFFSVIIPGIPRAIEELNVEIGDGNEVKIRALDGMGAEYHVNSSHVEVDGQVYEWMAPDQHVTVAGRSPQIVQAPVMEENGMQRPCYVYLGRSSINGNVIHLDELIISTAELKILNVRHIFRESRTALLEITEYEIENSLNFPVEYAYLSMDRDVERVTVNGRREGFRWLTQVPELDLAVVQLGQRVPPGRIFFVRTFKTLRASGDTRSISIPLKKGTEHEVFLYPYEDFSLLPLEITPKEMIEERRPDMLHLKTGKRLEKDLDLKIKYITLYNKIGYVILAVFMLSITSFGLLGGAVGLDLPLLTHYLFEPLSNHKLIFPNLFTSFLIGGPFRFPLRIEF